MTLIFHLWAGIKWFMSVAGRHCSFARNLSLKQSFRYKLPSTEQVSGIPRSQLFCFLSGAVEGKGKPVEIAHLWQLCPGLSTFLHKQGEKSEPPFQLACRQHHHSWDRGCWRHSNPAGRGVFLPLYHLLTLVIAAWVAADSQTGIFPLGTDPRGFISLP